MPWGTSETCIEGRERYLSTLREVTARAHEIVEKRIRELSKPDKIRLTGMFGFLAINKFAKQKKIDADLLALLLIVCQYEVFYKSDLIAWGIIDNAKQMPPAVKALYGCKYVIKQTGKHKVSYLYMSIEGKRLIKEYDAYLKSSATTIKNSNKNNGAIHAKYKQISRDLKSIDMRGS